MRSDTGGDASPSPSAQTGDRAEYEKVMNRYKKAKGKWQNWSDIWEEIYDYVLPHRESFFGEFAGQRRTENIYDETAVTGLPRFASRLQLGFFPPNGRAFKLAPGPEYPSDMISTQLLKELDDITELLHEGLRNSNFNSEFHEGLQDLGIGTMNMLVESGRFVGDLHFTAVPPSNVALLSGAMDQVTDWFRWNNECDITDIKLRYPQAEYSNEMAMTQKRDPRRKTRIIEATMYDSDDQFKDEYTYYLISETDKGPPTP